MRAHFYGEFVSMLSLCDHMFNMRYFNLMDLLWTNHKVVNCVTQHVICNLFSNSFAFCCKSWMVCMLVQNTPNFWGSTKGNDHGLSCPLYMVVKTTHTHSTLEINFTGYSYQTHHAGCLLYVGCHHSAGKMLCPHALLLELPHFDVSAVE